MGGKTYKRIALYQKAADILECISNQKNPVTTDEIAKAANLPYGTAMCHLVSLQDIGYVRAIGDCWVLGMALAKIWARVKSREESRLQEAQRNLTELELG